ncbi:MAG: hypothetical protein ACM3H8_13385 [Sphingobacteriales bacterium]
MKPLLILLFFASCFFGATAQNNFLVYSVKGNVTVTDKKVESKAKIGTLLNAASVIKISASSSAAIICNETHLFIVSKAGTYTMSQFNDSCETAHNSVTANYVKYIWSQFTHGHAAPESNRKLYMNNVGSVSRSVNSIWIDPRLDSMNYAYGNFPLSWKSYSEAKEFEFQLYDQAQEGKLIYKEETKNKKYPVPAITKIIQPGKTYYWTATAKGETNDERKAIKVWSKDDFNTFLSSLGTTDDNFETAAEKNFRLGFQLEEARFFSEAYEHYQQAVKLQPDMPLYVSTLAAFKKDYDIK